jgi:hypothetical protein
MRRTRLCALALALAALGIVVAAAQATTFTQGPLSQASAVNPISGCPPDASGTSFPDSEVEPWLDVNPTNANNLIAIYQQDRYSNGGAKVNVAAASFDGGASWVQSPLPGTTRCSGGDFERASDPWVSFGPDGVAHAMSLVTDPDAPSGSFGANGMMYNRSTTGGASWEGAVLLTPNTSGRYLHDKNSMTADPNDADFVYAVWDRAQQSGGEIHGGENARTFGFKGPVMFTRTTNGGDTWEPPRKIYESGANKQTIGNQIVVEPQSAGGSAFDFFGDITNGSARRKTFGPVGIAFIRSDNKGATWSKPHHVADQLPMALFRADSVIDTEDHACPDASKDGACPIRAGDIIPDVAVNRTNGDLYVVWMDTFFRATSTSLPQWDSIAFTRSTNGGATWSTPIRVNHTPQGSAQNSQAFTPSVHVLNDGTIAVSYYDFRFNDTEDATRLDTDHWVVHCHPASENCTNAGNWNEETRVTPESFDIRTAPFARGYFLGDYMGLANAGGDILSAFGSTAGTGPSSIWLRRLTP